MQRKFHIWYHYRFLRAITRLYMYVGRHGFALLWSTVTGVLTGVAVVIIRGAALGLERLTPRWAIFALVGIFIGKIVKLRLGDHGDTNSDMEQLLKSIRVRRPGLIRLETFSHILAAPLTIGLGGSAGLATPSVLAGASIGGNLGRGLNVPNARRLNLMVCGTAAGIAGIFNTPLAGVLFAIEILMPHAAAIELVPVLLAAAAAAVVTQSVFGDKAFFTVPGCEWSPDFLPYYLLLGVAAAVVGIGMVRTNRQIGRWLDRIANSWVRLLVGGGAVVVLLMLFPVVGGEGNDAMQTIFSGRLPVLLENHWLHRLGLGSGELALLFALGAVFFKIVASALTLDSGGSGGYFTPTLFCGAFTGLAFANAVALLGGHNLSVTDFIAAGMCGVFASAFRAPLTGIFLVNEMTGGNRMMLPLIAVAAISFFLTMYLERESIYGVLGKYALLTGGRSGEVGGGVPAGKLMEVPKTVIRPAAPPASWEQLLADDPAAEFAVVDTDRVLLGILRRSRIVPGKMSAPETLAEPPTGVLSLHDSARQVRAACRIFGRTVLPVVDARFHFRGFVYKAHLPEEKKAVKTGGEN